MATLWGEDRKLDTAVRNTIADLVAVLPSGAEAEPAARLAAEVARLCPSTVPAPLCAPVYSTAGLADLAADVLALLDVAALQAGDVVGVPVPVRGHGDLVLALAAMAVRATIAAPDHADVTVSRATPARTIVLDAPVSDRDLARDLRRSSRVVLAHAAPGARGWFTALVPDEHGRRVLTAGAPVDVDAAGRLLLTGAVPTGWIVRPTADGLLEPVSFDGPVATVPGGTVDVAAATDVLRRRVPGQPNAVVLPGLVAFTGSGSTPEGVFVLLDGSAVPDTIDQVARLSADWLAVGVPVRPVWLAPESLSMFAVGERDDILTRLREEYDFERGPSQALADGREVELVTGVLTPQLGWLTVGRDEDLFTLGLDSFELVEMLIVVESRFGTQVDVVALFEEPTVARLAGLLVDSPPPTPKGGPVHEWDAGW